MSTPTNYPEGISSRFEGEALPFERSLVVDDRAVALDLTRHGIASTTFADVLDAAPDLVRGYFGTDPAVVVIGPSDRARAGRVRDRLVALGVRCVTAYRRGARRLP